jgi:hypothetical protein
VDDTTHRITDSEAIYKPSRDGKLRKRSGVYASGLMATTEDNHTIALFQTNIGHAGEFTDEIFTHRPVDLPPQHSKTSSCEKRDTVLLKNSSNSRSTNFVSCLPCCNKASLKSG